MPNLNKVTPDSTAKAVTTTADSTAPVKASSSAGFSMGGMCAFSAGASAALLQALHSEIVMQSKLISMTASQEAFMIEANTSAAYGQAKATIASGNAEAQNTITNAWGTIGQGISEIGGTALGGAVTLGHSVAEGSGFYGEESTRYSSQLKQMRSSLYEKSPESDLVLSNEEKESGTINGVNVEARKQELLEGNFNLKNADVEADKKILKTITDKETKKEILKKIDSRIEEIDNRVRSRQDIPNFWSNFAQVAGKSAGQLAQGCMSVNAAVYTKEKALYDAQVQIEQNLSQQANNVAQTMDGKLKSVYDEELSEFQAYVQAAAVGARA